MKDAHASHVTALIGLPGDDALMGGSAKGVIRIWGAKGLSLRTEGPAHTAAINQLICEGENVYSVSSDRTVKVWRYRPLRAAPQIHEEQDDADVEQDAPPEDDSSENETTDFPYEGSPTETETTTLPFATGAGPELSTPFDRDTRRLTYNLGSTPPNHPNLNTTFDLSSPGGAKLAWNAGSDDLAPDE